MSPENESEEEDGADVWGQLSSSIASAKEEEDDKPPMDVVSNEGLPNQGSGDLPYVKLLKAAVSMVRSGEISMDEYVEGVKKLDAIADSALKVYSIPAVKNELPGQLSDTQNAIVGGLESEIHRMKEGLGILLKYPETQIPRDLDLGLNTAVSAMNAIADIQGKAKAESARIDEEQAADKARRAEQAAQAEADS